MGLPLRLELFWGFTYASTATNPTLNVNSTGAKPIYHSGTNITSGMITAGKHAFFQYNGTQWVLLNPEPVALNNKITTLESQIGNVYLGQGYVVMSGLGTDATYTLFNATQMAKYGSNPYISVVNGDARTTNRVLEAQRILDGLFVFKASSDVPVGQNITVNYFVAYKK